MLKHLITPAEPVPAARLGRVHFAGIGGAGRVVGGKGPHSL